MNRMRALAAVAAAVLSVGAFDRVARGQADAADAFRAGKQAFEAGQFDKARDQFATAARTDTRNPEVFLWLGKAEYQLGQVDLAVEAWKRTAALAPEEPYAGQMLKALTGKAGTADTALAVAAALLADELWDPAVAAADRLLADRALTDPQRVRAAMLRAEGLLGAGRHADALAAVNEVLVRHPAAADPAETKSLAGRAKLRAGPAQAAAGVAMLKDVVANHPVAPAAAVAQYELLAFQLEQDAGPATVDALAKWLAAHPDHARATAARRALVGAYLTLAGRGGGPGRDAALSPSDLAALTAAGPVYARSARAADALAVTQAIVAHLDEFYAANGAYAAAKAGAEAVLKFDLPATSRAVALRARARYATELAVRDLTEQVQAGKAAPAAGDGLPPGLAEAVEILGQINKESAGDGAWKEQAALAERLRGLAAQVPWPAKVTALKPPLAWAVRVALPAAGSAAEPAAAAAVQTVSAVADEVARAEQADPKGLAAAVNAQLLAAVRPDGPAWADVAWRQVNLLDAAAAHRFRQNVRDGKPQDNAALSPPQQALVATLAGLAGRQAALADRAVQRLDEHLQPWLAFGHSAVAEAAYAELAKALPEKSRRLVELAGVNLWVRRAVAEHNRLAAGGLTVPKDLDPLLAKAMARLYELQDDLPGHDPFLAQVRSIAESVVTHYKGLGYHAAAEAAAQVRPVAPAGGGAAAASPAGDAFAQFQVARLRDEAARREQAAVARQFGGAKKLTLTDPVKAAVAAYTRFIADHPTDPLAERAAAAVFDIAATFQQQAAHEAAIQVYKDLAAFAATRPPLAQAPPGSASLEERAAFAALTALEGKARAALDEARGAEKGELKPPAQITPEYAAAVAAYAQFVKDRPAAASVGAAVNRLMAIAADWARVDAWDVADGVYAVLLKPELNVRDPERIEFARGVCQVGKVMPDHAREVLAALAAGREAEPIFPSTSPALAGSFNGDGLADVGGIAGAARGTGGDRFGRGGGGGFGGGGGAPAGAPSAAAAVPPPATPPAEAAPGVAADAPPADNAYARADREVVAAISSQEARRAALVARMRDQVTSNAPAKQAGQKAQFQARNIQNLEQKLNQQVPNQQAAGEVVAPPELSAAELARQAAALDAAYKAFQGIRAKTPISPTAAQARGEILLLVGHWRAVGQWPRAADLARRFLADNPTDPQLPQVRLAIAQDVLTWAAEPVDAAGGNANKQQVLGEVSKRFEAARAELAAIAAEFPGERQVRQDAQWQRATSFLTQAHAVGAFSPTLARGQYARAVREMQRAADEYHDHPQVATIPQVLWDISQELAAGGYWEEAIGVWNELMVRYPASPPAQQAAARTAAAYQDQLGRPLRAAEVYLELNYARGGRDAEAQNAIYRIGGSLKSQSRWVESLHVLQTFVASFPKHPQAGQALTMIGQIHQTNEAWADAIDAYKRVISEFAAQGPVVQEARWAIAECTINLSLWREAVGAYGSFAASYPKDARVPEANRRIGVLKDLARYQQLVDERGAKAFDAQFQIGTIVNTQLANPAKAIAEFRKVAQQWGASHLADDALYQVGAAYLQQGRTAEARAALAEMAAKYPESPLADDALLAIGRSYEDEAQRVAGWTREGQADANKDVAQRQAYVTLNGSRAQQRTEQQAKVQELRRNGEGKKAELEEARGAAGNNLFDNAQVSLAAEKAKQDVESQTATQLADRQDKINAALRKAVEAYATAAKVPGADKAGEALLRVATIHDERLHDSPAAMAAWLEIVRQFSGTTVAEEASWRIAQNYERGGQYAAAIDAYKAFLRNYRGSGRAGDAQFSVAENYEHLNEWVKAMDSYGNYVNSFPGGTLIEKAKEQITWIKTYRL
jgi:tetratricopeptide (TPR) repeat protein